MVRGACLSLLLFFPQRYQRESFQSPKFLHLQRINQLVPFLRRYLAIAADWRRRKDDIQCLSVVEQVQEELKL